MKKVMIHLSLWVFWYSSTNISAIVNYKQTPWAPAFYNFISLAVVFYLSYILAKRYIKHTDLVYGLKQEKKQKFQYFVLRKEVAGILAVIFGTMFISWNVDHVLFGQNLNFYLSENFWMYADGKFARMAFYIGAGIGVALIYEIRRRKNQIIAQKDAYIEIQAAQLNAEKYDNKFLRNTIDERHKRIKKLEEYLNERDN
jgi:hypothetical protein